MRINIVTIGAGGYAATYVRKLLGDINTELFNYVGVVDINIEKSPVYGLIKERNIPVFTSLENFYASGGKADLVLVLSPPQFHAPQSILAVEHGADVLCEKPISPLYRDALAMKEASETHDKFIAIGYQWSYSDTMRTLKRDIMSGKFGKAIEMRSFVSWPRGWDYYQGWKGRVKGENGEWILDSVVENAAAHYLHNMYYLLGDAPDTSDSPSEIRSELFRANEIESFDTCLLDIRTKKGVRLVYVASHATGINEDPKLYLSFENCKVYMNETKNDNHVYAVFNDGSIVDYGNPEEGTYNRLWDVVDAVRTRKPLPCVVKTALPHTLTVNRLWEKGVIADFPKELVKNDAEHALTSVAGLYGLLQKAFEDGKLLSDMGIEWAVRTDFAV